MRYDHEPRRPPPPHLIPGPSTKSVKSPPPARAPATERSQEASGLARAKKFSAGRLSPEAALTRAATEMEAVPGTVFDKLVDATHLDPEWTSAVYVVLEKRQGQTEFDFVDLDHVGILHAMHSRGDLVKAVEDVWREQGVTEDPEKRQAALDAVEAQMDRLNKARAKLYRASVAYIKACREDNPDLTPRDLELSPRVAEVLRKAFVYEFNNFTTRNRTAEEAAAECLACAEETDARVKSAAEFLDKGPGAGPTSEFGWKAFEHACGVVCEHAFTGSNNAPGVYCAAFLPLFENFDDAGITDWVNLDGQDEDDVETACEAAHEIEPFACTILALERENAEAATAKITDPSAVAHQKALVRSLEVRDRALLASRSYYSSWAVFEWFRRRIERVADDKNSY